MNEDLLAERFEAHRGRLRSVAYRMLGSTSEADDAVQEAWLRLARSDAERIDNLGGWLTTVVARVCLNLLRSRTTRREEPLDVHVPDPVVRGVDDPEDAALLADSVGLALLVVLETLPPAERLAFVLHDMFAVPFDEIATIVDRTPATARQLASRARRRVQGTAPAPDTDRPRQREIVDAFLAASRGGDFEALVALLDPDVVLRADAGALPGLSKVVVGAQQVASNALAFRSVSQSSHLALVNGAIGVVSVRKGVATAVMGLTFAEGRIATIDILADLERLRGLDLTGLGT